MVIDNSLTCSLDNGPRPAGQPDRCFYCGVGISVPHRQTCVLRKRTVVLKVTTELLCEVPEFWTTDDVDFFYNESSSCSNNILRDLTQQTLRRQGETPLSDGKCACSFTSCEFAREAELKDHDKLKYEPKE